MNRTRDNENRDELQAWISHQLEAAVQSSFTEGVFDSVLVEAKPAWVLPFQLLIGRIRNRGDSSGFVWFICGDCPTDYLSSKNASSPREAARHFALKWQLDGARGTGVDNGVVQRAEALYELTLEEGLWLDQ